MMIKQGRLHWQRDHLHGSIVLKKALLAKNSFELGKEMSVSEQLVIWKGQPYLESKLLG